MSSEPPDALSDRKSQQLVGVSAMPSTSVKMEVNHGEDTQKSESLPHDSFSDINIYAGPSMEFTKCQGFGFVLAKHSEVLRTMIEARWKAGPADDREGFRTVEEYMYSGELGFTLPSGTLIEALALAKKYDIPDLTAKITYRLSYSITTQNALSIYFAAKLYDLEVVRLKAFDMITVETTEIIKSDEFFALSNEHLCEFLSNDELCVPELDLLLAVFRWAEEACVSAKLVVNVDNCRVVLKDALKLIRYNELTAEQFVKIADENDIFEGWEKYEILQNLSNLPPREKKAKRNFEYNQNSRYSNKIVERMDAPPLFLFRKETLDLYNNGLATTFVQVNKAINIHTLAVNLPAKTGGKRNKVLVTVVIKPESDSPENKILATHSQHVKLSRLQPTYCQHSASRLHHFDQRVIQEWNSLPVEIRNSVTVLEFKVKLDSYKKWQ